MSLSNKSRQQGVALIVALIMLLLLMLMVGSAFQLSGVNLAAVGNVQSRNEVVAAANVAIEQTLSSSASFSAPAAKEITVGDYKVNVAKPSCLRAVDVQSDTSADQNPNILIDAPSGGGVGVGGATGFQDTYWNIAATVDDALTAARVVVNQGIKITLPANPNPCPAG